MRKKTKRKLFVILMALTLIVTLMPTMAFAEGASSGTTEEPAVGVTVQSLNVAMLEDDTDGEGNNIVIDKKLAEDAEFVLEEKPGTRPLALVESTEGDEQEPLRKYTGTVKYENGQAIIEFGEPIVYGTYTLSETKAPTRYSLSGDKHTIIISESGAYTLLGSEYAPIPETGLEFKHEKKAEVSIPIEKIVTGDAAPDESFTAKLSVYREHVSEVSASDETGTMPVLTFYSAETTSFKQDTNTITFYIDGDVLDGAELYLEEVNDGKTGWTYDPQVYSVKHGIPESEIIAHTVTTLSGEELNNVYGKLTKVENVGDYPTETEEVLDKATFTNTYTKSYSGGGSTTRYYNVKVNNGKALSIIGAELSRVVAGTTINAVADPAAEGKVFKGWEVVKGGITVGEADKFTFAMPHEDVEITAVYEDKAEPVTPADPGDSEEPAEPDDVDIQPDDYDGPVPKTGDAQAAELAIFAALMLMAAFGLKKVYNR